MPYPMYFHALHLTHQQDIQASWGSLSGIIEEIGAGQPDCIPGPLPASCHGRLSHGTSTRCASYCVERDAFLSVPGPGGWHDPVR